MQRDYLRRHLENRVPVLEVSSEQIVVLKGNSLAEAWNLREACISSSTGWINYLFLRRGFGMRPGFRRLNGR